MTISYREAIVETIKAREDAEPAEREPIHWANLLRWGKTFFIPIAYAVVYAVLAFSMTGSLRLGNAVLCLYMAFGIYLLVRYLRRLQRKHGLHWVTASGWFLIGAAVLAVFATIHFVGALLPEYGSRETLYAIPGVVSLIAFVAWVIYFLIEGKYHNNDGSEHRITPADTPLRK